ncbi:MAG: tetratricopeptide repeat protein, partial [Candidatus Wallbacteria bacterium]|nr:tetratricopeptide repeat protein [Candidatus Wallbacteria bacterium]
MKTGLWFGLIIAMISFSAVSAKSDNVPPHGYMSDARGLVVPKSSAPSRNLSPSTAADFSPIQNSKFIIQNFSSLKALINTSLWTLHLSKTLSDESAKDAAEQVYAASLDENERQSAVIAAEIVENIKTMESGTGRSQIPLPQIRPVPVQSRADTWISPYTRYPLFDQFEDGFTRATSNEKNGLGILAGKIEELLLQSNIRAQRSDYLSRIRKIIAQSQNAQVSFSEWNNPIQELIERFGLLVVTMHAQAINELINSGDKDEFGKQKAFIDPAFDLYTVLNKKYCIGSSGRETVEKVFSQAKDAYYAQNYGEAVELFRQVIKMDSAYASQNGCYWHIGKCYREWKKYNEAESAFKDSIRHDQTKPYKRQAF